MASNPNNIRLGPCSVSWGGKDLGLTKGGVNVTVKTATYQVIVDQYGKTPVNEYIDGRTVTVEVPMVETTTGNLAMLLAGTGATYTGGAVDATGNHTGGIVNVQSGVGISMYASAAPLVLHPIDKAATDHSEDFIVPLASTPGELTFSYMIDKERVFNMTFTGYPDQNSKLLFSYGVAASA